MNSAVTSAAAWLSAACSMASSAGSAATSRWMSPTSAVSVAPRSRATLRNTRSRAWMCVVPSYSESIF